MIKFSDLVDIKKAAPATKPEPDTVAKEVSPDAGVVVEVKARVIKGRVRIQKADDDKMRAFGWAYVAKDKDGNQMEDYSGDIVDVEVIEEAAYKFVAFYRDGSDNHERGGVGYLIESVVFTKEKQAALGIPEGHLPEGWFVGFQVIDPDTWDSIKNLEYLDFSIEGEAIREEIPDENEALTL